MQEISLETEYKAARKTYLNASKKAAKMATEIEIEDPSPKKIERLQSIP